MALKTRVENLSARPLCFLAYSFFRKEIGMADNIQLSILDDSTDMTKCLESIILASSRRNEKCIRRHQSTRPWCQVSWKIFGGKIWDRQWSLFTSCHMPKMNRQKSFMFYFVLCSDFSTGKESFHFTLYLSKTGKSSLKVLWKDLKEIGWCGKKSQKSFISSFLMDLFLIDKL